MRSGLQTPGAIPLLAIVVATLLSWTPVVCEAWGTYTYTYTYTYSFHPNRQSHAESAISQPSIKNLPFLDDDSVNLIDDCSASLAVDQASKKDSICDVDGDWAEHTNRNYGIEVLTASPKGHPEGHVIQKLTYYLTNGVTLCPEDQSLLHASSNSTSSQHHTTGQLSQPSVDQTGLLHVLSTRLRETWRQVCQIRGRSLGEKSSSSIHPNQLRQPRGGSRFHTTADVARRPQMSADPGCHNPSITHTFDSPTIINRTSSSSSFERIADETQVGGVASGPVERRGSYLAVLVSLIVGIMWF